MDTKKRPLSPDITLTGADLPGADLVAGLAEMQTLIKEPYTPKRNNALETLKNRIQKEWIAARLPFYSAIVTLIDTDEEVDATYLFTKFLDLVSFLTEFDKRLEGEFNQLLVDVSGVSTPNELAIEIYNGTSCDCLVFANDPAYAIEHVKRHFVQRVDKRRQYIQAICEPATNRPANGIAQHVIDAALAKAELIWE